MAINVRNNFQSDWSIAISGIAGPNGGSEVKPVGRVEFFIQGDNLHKSIQENSGIEMILINSGYGNRGFWICPDCGRVEIDTPRGFNTNSDGHFRPYVPDKDILSFDGAEKDWGQALVALDGDTTAMLDGLRDYLWNINGKINIDNIIKSYFRDNGYDFDTSEEEDEEDDWDDDDW